MVINYTYKNLGRQMMILDLGAPVSIAGTSSMRQYLAKLGWEIEDMKSRVRWETWNLIFNFGLYFSYAFLYIVSGIFQIFQKRWRLGLQNRIWKLGISYWNSNFEVLSFVGCHTSRVAYWDSKTHGDWISSIGLTSFKLWPKNCNFLE